MGREDTHVSGVSLALSELTVSPGRWSRTTKEKVTEKRKHENELNKNISIQSRSSVQFSRSAVSDSLRPHESQHARPVHHQLLEFTQTHVH